MAALLALAGTALAAQTAPEAAPLNHAHAIYLGSGLYLAGGRSVFVLRLAPRVTLRPDTEDGVGIRLRLNGTVGLYDFRPSPTSWDWASASKSEASRSRQEWRWP